MRSAVLLAQLTLWATTTHAFFPYQPQWKVEEEETAAAAKKILNDRDGLPLSGGSAYALRRMAGLKRPTAPEAVAREAARLSHKYDRAQVTNKAGSLTRRENNFKIMPSSENGGSMTAGVNQDGTDYSYFVQVGLGSKGTKLYMLIDTGAGSTWVMGSDCASSACQIHSSFGSEDSETLDVSDEDFSVSYGTGEVKGTTATDSLSVAGMSFKYQFGLATEISDDFKSYAFDGILGLSLSQGANENFLATMSKADELESNIFAIALNRASDNVNNGEISFGKVNQDLFEGDVTYTPLTDDQDWAVEIDDMSYNGKKAGVGGITSYIDTGTSFIFGPPDVVKKLHSVIPDAESSDGSTYHVPCDSVKSLTFTFSGVDFEVSPKDWISPPNSNGQCSSNIYGHSVVDGAWLLGDTFLKNVYAVFDIDEKRIGFANRASSAEGASASSSSSSSSSSHPSTVITTTSSSSSSEESAEVAAISTVVSTMTSSGHTSLITSAVTAYPDKVSRTMEPMGLSGHETGGSSSTSSKPEETSKDNDKDNAALRIRGGHHAIVCTVLASSMLAFFL